MLETVAAWGGGFLLAVLAVYILARVASAGFFKSRNQFNQPKKDQ